MPLDSTDLVRVETRDAVQTITLNRPDKKNALTSDMYVAMTDALKAGESDDATGCHLFLGQPGAFSAGNDIGDFMKFAMSGGLGDHILDFLRAVATVKKPVVAGVDGLAIGIGTTLLLHCDQVVASNRSLFRTPFTDLGLVPEAASSFLGPRIMGHQNAFALLALGQAFSPEEARTAHLITEIVAPEDLNARALEVAAGIAAKPREAMAIARRLLRGDPTEVLARIDEEAGHFAERLTSDEARAAFQAFLTRN